MPFPQDTRRRFRSAALVAALFSAGDATAAELSVTLTLPTLQVAEYHRPYVAVWVENEATKETRTLTHWYDIAKKENGGTKWLKDLRQWWRKDGRELSAPVDGISGATRNTGKHALAFSDTRAPLQGLPAGNYKLMAEAAREAGGREVVEIAFTWPPKKATSLTADGKSELGVVTLTLTP